MKSKRNLLSILLASVFVFCALMLSFSFISVKAEDNVTAEFNIVNGASVRLATDEEVASGDPVNGICFSAYLNGTYYENLLQTYTDASQILLKSTVSKIVAEGETQPTPFEYKWDITSKKDISFNKDGVAQFYHTINFKSLTNAELKMANAFEMTADFWIEVIYDGQTENVKIPADNASEVSIVRSMRQVAYMAYTTPSTEEKPNPNYKDKDLLKYFTLGETTEAVYDLDVKTKALSAVAPAGVTVDKAYVISETGILDVTGKTLADVFTQEEASVSTTKTLVFFDADNVAYTVQTRYVTKIINTVKEATNFFNISTATSSAKAVTGYYLLTEDLSFTQQYKYDRYFMNGTFDGDGHTLTVEMGVDHYHLLGLFGRISNVTVKNLQINLIKNFPPLSGLSTTSGPQRNTLLGYQSTSANYFENVQLNLSRIEGDTDENYYANNYPSLYLIGSTEKSSAKNLVVNIADGALIYPSTTVSINVVGFINTENCYMFSDHSALMKANDSSWGTFDTSISNAISKGQKFEDLVESKYWTLDKENSTLTFGKVVTIPEEPEDDNTGDNTGDTTYDYNPVVRFAVASDVHIRRYNVMGGVEQLEKIYDSAYAYSENSALNNGYNKLDGVFIVGDLTNYECDYEYPLYFDAVEKNTREGTLSRAVMGNHEYSQLVYSGNGNSWKNSETINTAINKFLTQSGYETEDYHAVINGYHFLFVSMDRYGTSSGTANEYVSAEKLAWLKQELDIAVAADPFGTKPIFVFQHVHPKDTVGNSSNSDIYIRQLLDKYPNVVDFSGHTHKPITDPRSIWQDTFTAINTGSMAYLSQNVRELGKGAKAVNEYGEWANGLEAEQTVRDGGLYYICEVDANNVMRITIYDTFSDSVFGKPYVLDSFGDPTGFDYKSDREEKSVAPEFTENAEITVENNLFNKTEITFPQAMGEDLVENYRIEVYNGADKILTEYRLSGVCYGNAIPKNMKVTLAGLAPSTTYTLKIYAINYWSKVSQPLVKEFTTAVATSVTPDIASITFNELGGVDALGGVVSKNGTCSVGLYETLNTYYGLFNANGAYEGLNLASWYSVMKYGFTVETYAKVTQAPSSGVYALVSNYDEGGFSLQYSSAGNYVFKCYVGSDYSTASYAGNINEWVHLVGVYDTSSLKLYINGELVATTSVSGAYMPPRLLSNKLVIGARPNYVNNIIYDKSKSNILLCNVYGYALNDAQVQSAYNNL